MEKFPSARAWPPFHPQRDRLLTCFDAELYSVIVLPWQCVLLWVCSSRSTPDSCQERGAVPAWGSSSVLPGVSCPGCDLWEESPSARPGALLMERAKPICSRLEHVLDVSVDSTALNLNLKRPLSKAQNHSHSWKENPDLEEQPGHHLQRDLYSTSLRRSPGGGRAGREGLHRMFPSHS